MAARQFGWQGQLACTMRMLEWIDEGLERLEREAGNLPADATARRREELLGIREQYDAERVRELTLISQYKHAGN